MGASSRFFFHEKEKALTTFCTHPWLFGFSGLSYSPLMIKKNSIGTCLQSLQGKDDYKNYLFVIKKYFVMINYNVMRFSINNEKLNLDYIH